MPLFFCQSTSLYLPQKTQNSIRWSCSFPFFVVFVQSEFPEFWVNIQSTIVNNANCICNPKPSTSVPRPVLVMAAGGDSGSRSSKQTCGSAGSNEAHRVKILIWQSLPPPYYYFPSIGLRSAGQICEFNRLNLEPQEGENIDTERGA